MPQFVPIDVQRAPAPSGPGPRSQTGHLNVAVAWSMIAFSMTAGAIVGLWAFGGPLPAPSGFETYDSLPRRLLRLAHVSAIALPVLNLLYVRWLDTGFWSRRTREWGCRLLLVGTLSMPSILTGAVFWTPLKYGLPLPVLSLISAIALQALAQLRGLARVEEAPR